MVFDIGYRVAMEPIKVAMKEVKALQRVTKMLETERIRQSGLVNEKAKERSEQKINRLLQEQLSLQRQIAEQGRKRAVSGAMAELDTHKGIFMGIVGAGLLGIGAVTKAAAEYQDILFRTDFVAKRQSAELQQWVKDNADTFQRSYKEMTATVSQFYISMDRFIPDRKAVLGLSEELTKMAMDLHTMNPQVKSLEEITKALTMGVIGGSTVSLRRLGIIYSLKDTQALEKSLNRTMGLTNTQAKVMARVALFRKMTENIMGAAGKRNEYLNSQLRKMRSNLTNVAVNMGEQFVPIMTKAVTTTNEFIAGFNKADWGKNAGRILGITTAISGVVLAIMALKGAVFVFSGVIKVVGALLGLTSWPVWAVALAIGALILIVEDLWTAFKGGKAVSTGFVGWLKNEYDNLILVTEYIRDELGPLFQKYGLVGGTTASVIKITFDIAWPSIQDMASEYVRRMTEVSKKGFIPFQEEWGKDFGNQLIDSFVAGFNIFKDGNKLILDQFIEGNRLIFQSFINLFRPVYDIMRMLPGGQNLPAWPSTTLGTDVGNVSTGSGSGSNMSSIVFSPTIEMKINAGDKPTATAINESGQVVSGALYDVLNKVITGTSVLIPSKAVRYGK